VLAIAFGMLVAAYVVVDEFQIAHWRNREGLWAHVVAVDPRNMVGIFKQALALEERDELAAAEARYRDALAVGDYTKAIAGLGRVSVKQGKIAEAFALRDWALRRAPGDPAVIGWLEMPAMKGQPPARTDAPALDRGTPSAEARALSTAGMRHARRREYREALELFRRATEVDPEYASAHNNAGLAESQLGDRVAAEKSLREAVRLAPNSADYAINLARLYLLMGRPAEALPLCEQAASLAPGDPEISLLRDRTRAKVAEGR
jgi:tetratricopeptide (TPR) repeat protein